LGHILAEDGRKMSKHLGNILEPLPLMDRHGADAVRWFMACSGSPWAGRRVGDATIGETVRKVLLTYWNTVAFQSLYARAGNWTPTGPAPRIEDRLIPDQWLASETATLVRDVTESLEAFDTQRAGALLASFVDDLSNWYVRRARRRFWNADPSSLWTLHETLHTLTRLLAPIMPFVTERVWQDMFAATDPEGPASVHLADWPVADEAVINSDLSAAMNVTRRLVQLGRAARSASRIKVRQPLSRMLVPSAALTVLTPELVDEVRGELNVNQLESFSSAGDLVEYSAKGNFRALGRRFGKQTPQVAAAVAATDAGRLATELAETGTTSVEFEGETLTLEAEDVLITERPREGWSVVNEQGETVALDLELTPALLRAGLAREVIRFVQEARKKSGLEVSDRIRLELGADGELGAAIDEHATLIADEVLAVDLQRSAALDEPTDTDEVLGLSAHIRRA
ncbi:MAG: DUF5915 domain-containing protein, partial [Arachnia sp.]